MASHEVACFWPMTLGDVPLSQHHAACQLKSSFGSKGLKWMYRLLLSCGYYLHLPDMCQGLDES